MPDTHPAPLSREAELQVLALFQGREAEEARRLLVHECGNNLPFLEHLTSEELDRYRFAALKVSGGDIDRLRMAVAAAKRDWRDLLVWAGFADGVGAHEGWRPSAGDGAGR